MKLSSIFCASFVALAALALQTNGANSRVEPTRLEINPLDDKAVQGCTDKGGKVDKDKGGKTFCTMPEDAASAEAKIKWSRENGSVEAKSRPEAGDAHRDPSGVLGCEAVEGSAGGGAGRCKDVQDNAVADTGMKTAKPSSDEKAGVTARTDGSRGVWKAPAGIEAQGIPDAAQSSEAPEWKYVSVRRMGMKLQEEIRRETKWVVFEPNNEPLWAKIRLKVGDYMMSQYRQGVFQGKTPKDAFFVRCDRSTMTQNDLDNGRLILIVGFAAVRPAEFVILKIRQQTLVQK